MNKRIELIRQRRDLLVMRADFQRFDLAQQIEPWKKPLSYFDRGLTLARRVRAHPTLIAVALAALAYAGRNRLGHVVRLGWSAWSTYRLFIKSRVG
jgi:hypothetical protein